MPIDVRDAPTRRAQDELYGRPWRESDYLLVLDLYLARSPIPLHAGSQAVIRVAELIGRTPDAVAMRLENFTSLESGAERDRVGLVNGGDVCRQIFRQWRDKPEAVRAVARHHRTERGDAELFPAFPRRVALAFGKYDCGDLIGEGAHAAVYSCFNISDRREYAIKVFNPGTVSDLDALHRFTREIRALRKVRHPNLVQVYDDNLDSEAETPAYVMDRARHNLAQWLFPSDGSGAGQARRSPTPDEAVSIIKDVCSAVIALHEAPRPVIHRDITWHNVLRFDDRWVLSDLGLVKFLAAGTLPSSFVTVHGSRAGTPFFAAPEQYEDLRTSDPRTDVYALGILMWSLFVDKWPPAAPRAPKLLPPALASVFLRATQHEPTDRYESAREFLGAFLAAMS